MNGSVDTCRKGRAGRTFSCYRLFCACMEMIPPGGINGMTLGSDYGGAGLVPKRLHMSCRGTGGRR